MRWWLNKDGENTGINFDDGTVTPETDGHGPGPGEEGFTRELVEAECARRRASEGGIWTADYCDVTWIPVAAPEG